MRRVTSLAPVSHYQQPLVASVEHFPPSIDAKRSPGEILAVSY